MKTNRCPPSPAPALVVADKDTSSFAPTNIPSRRARQPGWRGHSCCPSHPVICIVLSLSRTTGVFFICRKERIRDRVEKEAVGDRHRERGGEERDV